METTLTLLQTPILRVKMDKQTAGTFIVYLRHCDTVAFTGVNNFSRHAKDRETLFKLSLTDVTLSAMKALSSYLIANRKRNVIIPITHAQRIALSHLFRRVEVPPSLAHVELTIINHLIY